jgi:hypothetical protein
MPRLRPLAAATVAAAALLSALPSSAGEVAFPTGYRQWDHVKSMVINKGHPLYDAVGGIHHIYANPTALKGYRSGRFADGSVIVFDLFEAVDKDNAVSEGARKAVVVMSRNAKAHRATAGWGYQVFDPKTRQGGLDARAQGECHACHTGQKDRDYVFSTLRD